MTYGKIKWSSDRWRHVTLKGQTPDPNTLRVQYLENSSRCYLATIANYLIVCYVYEVVRSAILATAWLLVCNLIRPTIAAGRSNWSWNRVCIVGDLVNESRARGEVRQNWNKNICVNVCFYWKTRRVKEMYNLGTVLSAIDSVSLSIFGMYIHHYS